MYVMPLTELKIDYVRNIKHVSIGLHNNINLFLGANGTGKSSLLESVYFMFTGRSFRTRRIAHVIQFGQEYCLVSGSVRVPQSSHTVNQLINVGVQKKMNGAVNAKIGVDRYSSIASLAKLLPIQFHTPEDPLLLDASAEMKRRFIDWGVFHVEHSFHGLWRNANKILKQRNALLKSGIRTYSQLEAWDSQLAPLFEQIDRMRRDHLDCIVQSSDQGPFSEVLAELGVRLHYYSGWPKDETSLKSCWVDSFERDQERRFTHYGAHRADLRIELNGKVGLHGGAKNTLSRGQKKAVSLHLKMIQTKIVGKTKKQPAVFLLDDIGAEFDHQSIARVVSWLLDQDVQLFITAIDETQFGQLLKGKDYRMFHVEHGNVFKHEI